MGKEFQVVLPWRGERSPVYIPAGSDPRPGTNSDKSYIAKLGRATCCINFLTHEVRNQSQWQPRILKTGYSRYWSRTKLDMWSHKHEPSRNARKKTIALRYVHTIVLQYQDICHKGRLSYEAIYKCMFKIVPSIRLASCSQVKRARNNKINWLLDLNGESIFKISLP
jgi:hypothetical protein